MVQVTDGTRNIGALGSRRASLDAGGTGGYHDSLDAVLTAEAEMLRAFAFIHGVAPQTSIFPAIAGGDSDDCSSHVSL